MISIIFISRIFLERSTFTDNQGTTLSLIEMSKGKLNVTNCYFAENHCTEIYRTTIDLWGDRPYGANFSNTIIYYFFNCTFIRNYGYDGGGLDVHSTTIYFKKCVFKGNQANSAGAVLIQGAKAYFENCEFLANTAIFQVGAIYSQEFCNLVIINCSFQNNRGIGSAGAMKVYGPLKLRV